MGLVEKTAARIIQETFYLLLILGSFFVLFPQRQSLITGLAFGTLIAVLNFKLLKIAVCRFPKVRNPKRFLKAEYFKRQAIYAVAFIVAVRKHNLNNAAVVLGFLLPKIVIFLDTFILKKSLIIEEASK